MKNLSNKDKTICTNKSINSNNSSVYALMKGYMNCNAYFVRKNG